MARNVDDLALLLSVLAGPDPRVPLALGDPGATFAPPVTGSLAGLRVALSTDLGGAHRGRPRGRRGRRGGGGRAGRGRRAGRRPRTPTSPSATTPSARCGPGTSRPAYGALLAEHPDAFKQSLADNIRAGEALTGADVARAYQQRTALAETMRAFFEAYDVLVLPVSQVPPFPADQEFPTDDQRQADGVVPRLDALGVLHHRHRLPGDLGPGRPDRATGCPSASRSSRRTAPTGGCSRSRRPFEALAARPDLHRTRAAICGWNPPYLWTTRRSCGGRRIPRNVGESLLRGRLGPLELSSRLPPGGSGLTEVRVHTAGLPAAAEGDIGAGAGLERGDRWVTRRSTKGPCDSYSRGPFTYFPGPGSLATCPPILDDPPLPREVDGRGGPRRASTSTPADWSATGGTPSSTATAGSRRARTAGGSAAATRCSRTAPDGVRRHGRVRRGATTSGRAGDAALDEELTARFGDPVRVLPEQGTPTSTRAPVSLVGTATLEWCARELGVDADRAPAAHQPDRRDDRAVRGGGLARPRGSTSGSVRLARRRTRRALPHRRPRPGRRRPPRPRWLKALGGSRELCVGVYADGRPPGELASGRCPAR